MKILVLFDYLYINFGPQYGPNDRRGEGQSSRAPKTTAYKVLSSRPMVSCFWSSYYFLGPYTPDRSPTVHCSLEFGSTLKYMEKVVFLVFFVGGGESMRNIP